MANKRIPATPHPPGSDADEAPPAGQLITSSSPELPVQEETVVEHHAQEDSARAEFQRLRKALKKIVESHHAAGMRHLGAATLHFYLAGVALNAAKDAQSRNQWHKCLRATFGEGNSTVSIRTCQRYMRLAKRLSIIAGRRGITIDATRVSHADAEQILDGLSLRAALLLSSTSHELDIQDLEDHSQEESPGDGTLTAEPSPNEWLTPEELVIALGRLWPQIDLDPCSEGAPSPNIPALSHYTIEENGLAPEQPWFGNVFVNPGQAGNLRPWVARVVAEFEAGRVREALLLLPASTDADWAELVQPYPHAFLHARPRVSLATEPDQQITLPQPAMLIFLGGPQRLVAFAEHLGLFADVFQPFSFPASAA